MKVFLRCVWGGGTWHYQDWLLLCDCEFLRGSGMCRGCLCPLIDLPMPSGMSAFAGVTSSALHSQLVCSLALGLWNRLGSPHSHSNILLLANV